MKNKMFGFAVIAAITLTALFAISTTACGGGKRLNSADELKAYLDSLPVNSPDKPIKVAIKANDAMLKEIVEVLINTDKYVSLDLSGSPLTEIPDDAFIIKEEYGNEYGNGYMVKSCETLVGIIIPKGVTSIGNQAFYGCTNLSSVIIPNGVTSIGVQAFSRTNFKSITIPNSVPSIGIQAFSECASLANVTIPNSVTSIGARGFDFCTSLTSITIPKSVTSIGRLAFYGCNKLTSVTFQGTIPADNFGQYGGGDLRVKYLAGGIGTYTTTAPVNQDSTWTKKGDNSNKSSSSTRSNVGGGKSFNSADALKTYLDKQPVNSPDKPIKVAMKANDVIIKNIATVIRDAGKYVSLDLSGSPLTEIPRAAFGSQYDACKTLVGIIIPKGVTSIGQSAFYNCNSLTSVTIPNSVTGIGSMAFLNCTSLASVTIPNSVTTIGVYAFGDCSSLTSVTIPNSVTSIGMYAFSDCTRLTRVTFQGTIPSDNFDEGAFRDGNLRDKYLAGGVGTYTRPNGNSNTWTKQ